MEHGKVTVTSHYEEGSYFANYLVKDDETISKSNTKVVADCKDQFYLEGKSKKALLIEWQKYCVTS